MSLALHLAADAQADLRRLDPQMLEEVLDELERLAEDPSLIPPPLPVWGSVYVFVREFGTALYVVTLVVELDASRQSLIVLGVQSLTAS